MKVKQKPIIFKGIAPLVLGALFLVGCTTSPAKMRVASELPTLSLNSVPVCSGYTCHNKTFIKITQEEWNAIEVLFSKAAGSAEEERANVSIATGVFEKITGVLVGTLEDRPESPLLFKTTGQLDCVDEAFNTSIFLNLLDQHNLLAFHAVGLPVQRGHFIGGWPHSTGVLKEIETNMEYAVDSWFYDPGTPAEVLTLELWKSGWKPEKTKDAP